MTTGASDAAVMPSPILASPPRPPRPLSTIPFLRTVTANTVAICDEALFDEWVVVRRYGFVPTVFVNDPAAIRRVLVDAAQDYPRHPAIRRLYAAEIGTGTIASDGEVWERHRRVAAPTVDRRAIAADLPALIELAEASATGLDARIGGEPFDIEAVMNGLATDLLNRIMTGGDLRGLPILAWLSKVPRRPRLLDILPMPVWMTDIVSSARPPPERVALREGLLALLKERLDPAYVGPRDLLWRLAHAVDRDSGQPLPLPEARDEASSLVTAGDATVRALTWTWYLLALHPGAEARLHAELDATLGGAPLRPDLMRELSYTRRVMDEVLRLYPPIPVIVRKALRTDTLCGQRVPRGAAVFVMPWVVQRHRKLWTEPEVFDPDRFDSGIAGDRPRFAYIPFSAGPRTCTGASLAISQMLIVVAAFARRYRFRLVPGVEVKPRGGITLKPRGGLRMTLERR